jgi:hypothetical protein
MFDYQDYHLNLILLLIPITATTAPYRLSIIGHLQFQSGIHLLKMVSKVKPSLCFGKLFLIWRLEFKFGRSKTSFNFGF